MPGMGRRVSITNEELVSAIQAGERRRIGELWTQVERFVSMQAGKCIRQLKGYGGVTEEDLYQSGFLAMVDAADRYNSTSGKPFIGYLSFYLQTYFAQAAGYRTNRRDAVDYSHSLDDPIPGTDDLTVSDTVEDESAAADFDHAEHRVWLEQLHAALEQALVQLPDEQANMLRRRFYKGQTRTEISKECGIGYETVRKLEQTGLQSIRRGKVRRDLEQFVEQNTPYYTGTGLGAFLQRGRQPECLVLLREKLHTGE